MSGENKPLYSENILEVPKCSREKLTPGLGRRGRKEYGESRNNIFAYWPLVCCSNIVYLAHKY